MNYHEFPLLIPEIVEKIDAILNQLKLVPQETPQAFVLRTQGRKHRYSSVCSDEKGKKMFFYAGLHQKPSEKQRMETETKLAEVFMENDFSPYFLKYFKAGFEEDFCWLVREFFAEKPIENKNEIEKLERKLNKEEIEKIIEAIYALTNLPKDKFSFLKKFELEKYLELAEELTSLENGGVLSKEEVEKAKKLILENKDILEKENNYFVHGDFQIGNIIVFNNALKLIDFESTHLNNFAFDIAFFFSRLWREPETRKEILKEYIKKLPQEKKETFQLLFRIDCLFNGYHTFRSQPREYSTEILEKRKMFCAQLLKASLAGLEELVNL